MLFSRVINNEICYHAKEGWTLNLLFNTRYSLFKQVYSHRVGKWRGGEGRGGRGEGGKCIPSISEFNISGKRVGGDVFTWIGGRKEREKRNEFRNLSEI
jgi:hypothetical protein